jgi:hypothetical protein
LHRIDVNEKRFKLYFNGMHSNYMKNWDSVPWNKTKHVLNMNNICTKSYDFDKCEYEYVGDIIVRIKLAAIQQVRLHNLLSCMD